MPPKKKKKAKKTSTKGKSDGASATLPPIKPPVIQGPKDITLFYR
jgi:hypothetical protein